MALVLKDRVRESSTSSGTGSITLGGAFVGYQTFASAVASGSTVYYTIHNITPGNEAEWEVGVGTFTSPSTLSRDTVFSSSAGGTTKVNFTGSSTLEVFITQPAEQAIYINQATSKVEAFGNGTNSISFANITADLFTGNASAISAINASNISSGTIDNARTTAASANGASTIVLRGASGEFAAGAITGTSFSGNGSALTAINATAITTGTIDNARTTAASANGANTIVLRDASGDFSVDGITANWFTGNGANLSAINASNVSSGTLSATRGGTGSANLTADNVILGNGASAVKVVAPGTANNVLTSNGSTWISQAVAAGGTVIPAGTVMLFAQTAAPTGFTKNTTTGDNSALRVTTGTASTGGSVAFTTAFASQTPTGSVATTNTATTATNQATTATNQAITPTGSVSITAVSGSAGATTLTTPQIPSHTHPYTSSNGSASGGGDGGAGRDAAVTGATGGGGSHTHPFSFSSGSGTFTGNAVTALQNSHNHTQDSHNHTASSSFTGNAINLAVQYIDVIRATKD
jgi:hypothetical protein